MARRTKLDAAGQFFEFGGKGLELGDQRLGIGMTESRRGIEEGFQHHGDAGQDRPLDSLERVGELLLLVGSDHGEARLV